MTLRGDGRFLPCLTMFDLPCICIRQEMGGANPKVKREAVATMGTLHKQIGSKLKGLSLSLAKKPDIKNNLEKCFSEYEFDPSSLSLRKHCVLAPGGSVESGAGPGSIELTIPTTDLFSVLPTDILSKLVSLCSPRPLSFGSHNSHTLCRPSHRDRKTEKPPGNIGRGHWMQLRKH